MKSQTADDKTVDRVLYMQNNENATWVRKRPADDDDQRAAQRAKGAPVFPLWPDVPPSAPYRPRRGEATEPSTIPGKFKWYHLRPDHATKLLDDEGNPLTFGQQGEMVKVTVIAWDVNWKIDTNASDLFVRNASGYRSRANGDYPFPRHNQNQLFLYQADGDEHAVFDFVNSFEILGGRSIYVIPNSPYFDNQYGSFSICVTDSFSLEAAPSDAEQTPEKLEWTGPLDDHYFAEETALIRAPGLTNVQIQVMDCLWYASQGYADPVLSPIGRGTAGNDYDYPDAVKEGIFLLQFEGDRIGARRVYFEHIHALGPDNWTSMSGLNPRLSLFVACNTKKNAKVGGSFRIRLKV